MTNKKINKRQIIIVILFAILLFSSRYIWVQYFSNSHQMTIENGQLFMTEAQAFDGQVQIIGEWAFYPNELLEELPADERANRTYIQVPGGWQAAFPGEGIYGYGTYHLRIHVNPEQTQSYAMKLYSIRSSSSVFANGFFAGSSGQVSDNVTTYDPFNAPYNTYSMRPNEDGIIDVLIQVANFSDIRSGGIVRSVYFGTEDQMKATTNLSSALQIFSGSIFILHALFALIIYLTGTRNKRLIYFSFGLFMLAFFGLNTGDEKIIMQLTKMDYLFAYKISLINLFLIAFAIIHALKNNIDQLHVKIVPVFTIILVGLISLASLLPMDYLIKADEISMGSVFIAMILSAISLVKTRATLRHYFGLTLAFVAIVNHFAWLVYMMQNNVKVIFYPFDLIIALICISAVWFKDYNDMNVKLADQTRKLAEADKEKDLFLANTAHELKNPLHSMLNMSYALLEREKEHLQARSQQDLQTILDVNQRMTVLVNDLLEVSSLDDRQPTMAIKPTSLQAITAGVIHMNNYLLEGKQLDMINEIPADFQPLLADENRLIQIMYNLVHNAVKFTEAGTITIHAKKSGKLAIITVTDTGIGMDQATQRELFMPYRQGQTAHAIHGAGGLGLGLYIVKQLVEYMDGEIKVDSAVGLGTSVTFTLPISDQAEPEQVETKIFRQVEDQARANTQVRKKKDEEKNEPKLLVVDDDPVNLRVIEAVLETEAYEIQSVLSGKEAMTLIEKDEFDLVISDVMMPHMSGFELTKRIRQRFAMSELPVLLLTSRGSAEDVKHGFDIGASDYITKPIDALELKSRVKALTDVRSAVRDSLYLESAFLQAQIQPHFIFNVINSVMALSETNIPQMQKLLSAFSDVLRNKFQFKDMKRFIKLEEELQLIGAYLYIEKVRFGDRITIEKEIDDYIQVMIPAITIQPLVENAVIHGIMKRESGGMIKLQVIEHDATVEVRVTDNGPGIQTDKLTKINNKEKVGTSGVGIYNTNLRLIRAFGTGLHIQTSPDPGTSISFHIPKGNH